MASNRCDKVKRCKNSWWCAVDYNPANKDCFEAMTHGERLRAMTDEELAELFNQIETEGKAYGPRGKAQWLDWLRQEAT